jgi:hypothetical protein
MFVSLAGYNRESSSMNDVVKCSTNGAESLLSIRVENGVEVCFAPDMLFVAALDYGDAARVLRCKKLVFI